VANRNRRNHDFSFGWELLPINPHTLLCHYLEYSLLLLMLKEMNSKEIMLKGTYVSNFLGLQ